MAVYQDPMYIQQGQSIDPRPQDEPWVEIGEQPKAHGLRFRYKCEGRSAGSIPGEGNSQEHRTYPTIKIHNLKKQPAIVLVSCVTKDEPKPRPHPHSLVGKDCQKGVCTVRLKDTDMVVFSGLGIQCATRREVPEALKERESIRVDPYQTGYQQNVSAIDLNVVRLCFQVFLRDPANEKKFTLCLQPVTSQSIYDRKAVNDLVICRLSKHTGSVKGGEEIFLLCEKVNKDDVLVRFYEESTQGGIMWEGHGEFSVNDVHRQLAIVFKTPEYRDTSITSPAQVFMQLKRPSDGQVSEPKPFQYTPENPDPEGIQAKIKRKEINFTRFFQESGGPSMPTKQTTNSILKKRLMSRAERKNATRSATASTLTTVDHSQLDNVEHHQEISDVYALQNVQSPTQTMQTDMMNNPNATFTHFPSTLGPMPAHSAVAVDMQGDTEAATAQIQPQVLPLVSTQDGQQNDGIMVASMPETGTMNGLLDMMNPMSDSNLFNQQQVADFMNDFPNLQHVQVQNDSLSSLHLSDMLADGDIGTMQAEQPLSIATSQPGAM